MSPIVLSDKVVFQGVTQNEMAGYTAFANVFEFIQSSLPDFEYEIEKSTVAPSLRSLFVYATNAGTRIKANISNSTGPETAYRVTEL